MPVKTPSKKQPDTSKQAKATANELLTKPVTTPTATGNKGLPDGWRWVKLGDISEKVEAVKRTTQNPKAEFFYLDIGGIDNTRNKILDHKVYTWKDAPSRAQQVIRKNDILFSTVRTYMKNIAIIDQEIYNEQIASSGFCVIRAKSGAVDPKYIFYITLSNFFLQPLNELQTGSSYPAVRDKDVFSQFVPLPTLDKQQAIVSKIEELLSELDKGKQQLETAQQQLQLYRQTVLKWAFVNSGFDNYILKDVTEKIQIGPFGTQLHKEDYVEDGIPLINPMHIQDGNIVADNSYSITKEKLKSLPNYILKEGDVIMGRRGEMGRCGLVRKKESGWFCGTGSLYFRPDLKRLNSQFLFFYLSSEPVKKYLNDNAGGTTMANLNLKIVNEVPISLPSIEQQQLIVQEIESRMSVCDKVEETITTSLAQAETLRQSILKKAFEGKLI